MRLLFIGIIILVAVLINIPVQLKSRRLLSSFWSRSCTGPQWKRRFPDASKEPIREFLEEFVDAFMFKSEKRLKFRPDDKIMDVYRSLYPYSWCADSLEHVFLSIVLEKRYGFDLTESVMDPNITLGQLFEKIRNSNDGNSQN